MPILRKKLPRLCLKKRKLNMPLEPGEAPMPDQGKNDNWLFTCECDNAMIAVSPTTAQVREVIPKLAVGVGLELYWKPTERWYQGVVT